MEQQVNYPCETLIAFPQVDRHDLWADLDATAYLLLDHEQSPRRTKS
jgi:hypothetical protein